MRSLRIAKGGSFDASGTCKKRVRNKSEIPTKGRSLRPLNEDKEDSYPFSVISPSCAHKLASIGQITFLGCPSRQSTPANAT